MPFSNKCNKDSSIPGADIGSDHDLLMMTVKVKLTGRQRQDQARLRHDIEKLKDSAILDKFRTTLGLKSAPSLLLDTIQDISSHRGRALISKVGGPSLLIYLVIYFWNYIYIYIYIYLFIYIYIHSNSSNHKEIFKGINRPSRKTSNF